MTRACLTAILLGAFVGPVAAQTFDAADGFSIANGNPNGVWTYGWSGSLGGPVSTASVFPQTAAQNPSIESWALGFDLPAVYHNNSNAVVELGPTRWQPNGLVMHPSGGAAPYAVLRFTSPAAGTYALSASAEGANLDGGGTSTDVHVLVNGTESYTAITVQGFGPGSGGSISDPGLVLTTGDTVDLWVGPGNNGFASDSTAVRFALSAAPVPEPTAVLAAAAVGLTAVARRRRYC